MLETMWAYRKSPEMNKRCNVMLISHCSKLTLIAAFAFLFNVCPVPAGVTLSLLREYAGVQPSMSPDGTRIIFHDDNVPGIRHLYLDTVTMQLHETLLPYSQAEWRDDGILHAMNPTRDHDFLDGTDASPELYLDGLLSPITPESTDFRLHSNYHFEDHNGNHVDEDVFYPGFNGLALILDGMRIEITTPDDNVVSRFSYDPIVGTVTYNGYSCNVYCIGDGERSRLPLFLPSERVERIYHIIPGTRELLVKEDQLTESEGEIESFELRVCNFNGDVTQTLGIRDEENGFIWPMNIQLSEHLLVFEARQGTTRTVRVYAITGN